MLTLFTFGSFKAIRLTIIELHPYDKGVLLMKRKSMMVTAVPVICLSLAACGGSDSNADKESQSPVAQAPTAGANTQSTLSWKTNRIFSLIKFSV